MSDSAADTATLTPTGALSVEEVLSVHHWNDHLFSFKITRPGKWYVTLINMQKATGDADYESNWSTVTFEVR